MLDDETALGSDFYNEQDTPFCGRPRKPRPLILSHRCFLLDQPMLDIKANSLVSVSSDGLYMPSTTLHCVSHTSR